MVSDPTYNRHGGNEASNAAYEHVKPSSFRTRQAIVDFIWAHNGVTSEDVQAHLRKMIPHSDNWPLNAFSGRISELKRDKLVDVLPALRGGRQVLVRYESQMRLLGEVA